MQHRRTARRQVADRVLVGSSEWPVAFWEPVRREPLQRRERRYERDARDEHGVEVGVGPPRRFVAAARAEDRT